MPWSGGSFTRTNGVHTGSTLWAQDRDAGTKILATRHDTQDQDIADGVNATLEKSGSNAATGDLDIGSNRITLMADGTAKTDAATVNQIQSNGAAFQATDSGSADTYVIALSPAITAYAAGQMVTFKAANASTGASTLNVNTLGAKTIKKLNDQDIASGDIESGSIVTVVYDGTNFQMTSQTAAAGGQPLNANLTDIAAITQVNGDGIMSDGTDYKAVPWRARNLIINGAAQIAQYGTSEAAMGGTTGYFTVDRFIYDKNDAGTGQYTQAQSATGPDQFSTCLRFDCSQIGAAIAADEVHRVGQRIEAQNLQLLNYGDAAAKDIVVSFWVKSNLTGDFGFIIEETDGSRVYSTKYTINSADTWEKKVIVIPGDTGGTINDDTGVGLAIYWALVVGENRNVNGGGTFGEWVALANNQKGGEQATAVNMVSSTDNDWSITGVQVEVGSIDTPFEHLTYADELRACDRYFQRYDFPSANSVVAVGFMNTTTRCGASFPLREQMRAAPSLSVSNVADFQIAVTGAQVDTTNVVLFAGGVESINIIGLDATTGSAQTAGEAAMIRTDATGNRWLAVSAEL
ncbi:MAG: hypothetical protein QF435_13210 [Arenicellales bacterium]|nr:hypothetical protein [Arenicellales bacterium]